MDAKFRSGSTYNTNAAIRDVLKMLDGASLIYRSTTFTIAGTPAAGVAQFAAKRVLVYTTDSNNPYVPPPPCRPPFPLPVLLVRFLCLHEKPM